MRTSRGRSRRGSRAQIPTVRQRAEAALERALANRGSVKGSPFVDEVPDQPLLIARYEPDYALELIAGTGWNVLEVHPPQQPFIQHYMICAPV